MMVVIFFILNMIIFSCTCLGIIMFHNNLKKISTSIDIYLDPRTYKPESQVKLISLLIEKYTKCEKESFLDLDALIEEVFYSVPIGKFKTAAIETLARKGKGLLWINIVSMTLYEMIKTGLGQSNINSIVIILSAGIGVLLAFFEMYIDINMGKAQLFVKIKNYLNNEYPQFRINQKEKEEVSILLEKIKDLEKTIDQHEEANLDKKENKVIREPLQEEDIIQIIRSFDFS